MLIRYFFRQRGSGFSMEEVFASVRNELAETFRQKEFFCPYRKASPSAMWANCRAAVKHAGEVNHITGEVHYLAMALPRKGLVLTIHDTGDTNAFRGCKQAAFRYLWYIWPIRRVAAVTFVSEFARRTVEQMVGFPIRHAWVIPDPVSPRFTYIPKAFGMRPRILCLGTKPNKNLERLAEALKGLDFELRIIGKLRESQRVALDAASIRYSTVSDLSLEEIVLEYQEADLVSMISTFEGFGLPIVEGQASGRPVITSNIGAMVETAGEGALLVDPFDIQSMRDGFLRIQNEPELRTRLVQAGFENVRRFRADAIARQYEHVYHSVLKS